jgi:hypothetical protein
MNDELDEIKQATREILAAVHTITDQVQPPENARAMVLGIAAEMILRNMRDGEEPGAADINEIWKERGFPWRMDRVQ